MIAGGGVVCAYLFLFFMYLFMTASAGSKVLMGINPWSGVNKGRCLTSSVLHSLEDQ